MHLTWDQMIDPQNLFFTGAMWENIGPDGTATEARTSLAHGRASGPTPILTGYVLRVGRPTWPGSSSSTTSPRSSIATGMASPTPPVGSLRRGRTRPARPGPDHPGRRAFPAQPAIPGAVGRARRRVLPQRHPAVPPSPGWRPRPRVRRPGDPSRPRTDHHRLQRRTRLSRTRCTRHPRQLGRHTPSDRPTRYGPPRGSTSARLVSCAIGSGISFPGVSLASTGVVYGPLRPVHYI
jgi:hypothetical protein